MVNLTDPLSKNSLLRDLVSHERCLSIVKVSPQVLEVIGIGFDGLDEGVVVIDGVDVVDVVGMGDWEKLAVDVGTIDGLTLMGEDDVGVVEDDGDGIDVPVRDGGGIFESVTVDVPVTVAVAIDVRVAPGVLVTAADIVAVGDNVRDGASVVDGDVRTDCEDDGEVVGMVEVEDEAEDEGEGDGEIDVVGSLLSWMHGDSGLESM